MNANQPTRDEKKSSPTEFTEDQLSRYARHILLPEVGGKGQARLLGTSVLVVGAGGLGSPVLLYLAAAGVGRIGIIDDDAVDLSNLQRQIIHATSDIGRAKTDSAKESLAALNPEIKVETHDKLITAENALDIIATYDLIADGSDNFATRYLVNDACHLAGKPLVSAAILRFDAQISTFKSYLGSGQPCYRCIFPEPPREGLVPSCAEAGVFGAVAGVAGTLQATEIIKELLGIGEGLSGRLMLYDALGASFQTINVKADPACPLCGETPRWHDLGHHKKSET
ncbi:MAG: molybdopterin-synthase adenylyltransferase MoeB [Rhodospirillaceae bacterium]|jgi:molybdopterin-synthase adenylyltransferase|nr:molybdopterin-synthase adenylyltransferase MoeB [Rhodospirillaceae bacterium]MBT5751163.1 molybdopterin-synthase adenylyltransferase MoeB [Rhodospirillaceae bacterium]